MAESDTEHVMSIVDWDATHRNIPGGADRVRLAVDLMLQECTRGLEEVRAGLAAGDLAKVGITAHRLKGSVRHFGARSVMEAAARVEAAAEEGDLEGAKSNLPALEEQLRRMATALAERNGKSTGGGG